MKTKYTEIFRLRDMLDNAGIKYKYADHSFNGIKGFDYKYEQYQIEVYNPKNPTNRIISVIEGDGSYGRYDNLLEIMGCLTPEEKKHDIVCGWLTAEDVFQRIKNALAEVDNEQG